VLHYGTENIMKKQKHQLRNCITYGRRHLA